MRAGGHWAGALFEVTRAFGREQCGQRPQKNYKESETGKTDQPTGGQREQGVYCRVMIHEARD